MKTRQGFVSNSSSSSFIIITTKENHERVLKDLHPFYQEIIKILIEEGASFLGKDVIYIMDMLDSIGESSLFGDYGSLSEFEYKGKKPEDWDEDERDFCSVHDDYVEKLKEKPEEVFTAQVDL